MFSLRLAGCLVVWAIPVMAQAPVTRLSLGAGSATDLRGVRSGAYVLAPSLTLFPSSNVTVAVGGRGIRFMGEGWSLGGGGSANARIPIGRRFGVLIGAAGDAVHASYGATYLQAETTPALGLRLGSFELWGGAHGAVARSSAPDVSAPLGLPAASRSVVRERSAVGAAFGAVLTVAAPAAGEGARLTYREEHGRPDGALVVDRVAGAVIARGAVTLSGTLGLREAPGDQRGFGGGQMMVRVARGIAIFGAAESYPSNRLTGAVGGRSFSAGLTFSAGGRRAPRTLPRPSGTRPPAASLTRLSIEATEASKVEVAGDWNRWQPAPLRRAENGVWYGDFAIPPGEYRYAFRIDGTTWEVPRGVAAVNDGFGGKSAWLSVRAPGRKSEQSANKEIP
jgi:hypothetical protein